MGRRKTYNWAINSASLGSKVHLSTMSPTAFLALPGWYKGAVPYGFFSSGKNVAHYITRTWDDAHEILTAPYHNCGPRRAIAGIGKELDIPAHSFSVVGVCPAYVKPDARLRRSPYEYGLAEALHYLMPGGIALVCVPDDTLAIADASFLTYLLRRFEVIGFGYLPWIANAHARGVGFAVRARKTYRSVRPQEALGLLDLLRRDRPELTGLNVDNVPALASGEVTPFESSRVNPQEALRLAAGSALFPSVAKAVLQPLYDATPPMPPKTGHIALNLSTGRLNGVVGDGRFRHVVNGRVVRGTEQHVAETEDGEVLTVHDVLGVEITAIDAGGQVFAFRTGPTTTADEEDGA